MLLFIKFAVFILIIFNILIIIHLSFLLDRRSSIIISQQKSLYSTLSILTNMDTDRHWIYSYERALNKLFNEYIIKKYEKLLAEIFKIKCYILDMVFLSDFKALYHGYIIYTSWCCHFYIISMSLNSRSLNLFVIFD